MSWGGFRDSKETIQMWKEYGALMAKTEGREND
jgi:hypothetical protein